MQAQIFLTLLLSLHLLEVFCSIVHHLDPLSLLSSEELQLLHSRVVLMCSSHSCNRLSQLFESNIWHALRVASLDFFSELTDILFFTRLHRLDSTFEVPFLLICLVPISRIVLNPTCSWLPSVSWCEVLLAISWKDRTLRHSIFAEYVELLLHDLRLFDLRDPARVRFQWRWEGGWCLILAGRAISQIEHLKCLFIVEVDDILLLWELDFFSSRFWDSSFSPDLVHILRNWEFLDLTNRRSSCRSQPVWSLVNHLKVSSINVEVLWWKVWVDNRFHLTLQLADYAGFLLSFLLKLVHEALMH